MERDVSRRFWAAVAALTALAFVLRAWGLGRHVLDMDELLQFYLSARAASLAELLPLLRRMPLHAVLDPLGTFLLAKSSHELWWLRLQPALLGAACVPALCAPARRFGDGVALLAGALLAVSVHHIEFSGFVDFYPFMVLWALLTTGLLLRAVEDGGWRGFTAYAAAMAGFLYTHPWAVLLMGFHGLWLLGWRRPSLKPFLLAASAAFLAFLPWLLYAVAGLLAEPRVHYAFPQRAALVEAWTTLRCWAGAPERGFYDETRFAAWVGVAAPLYAALAGAGLWSLTRARAWNAAWALAASIALGGMPAVLLADRLSGYDFAPRQALFALPFFLLFVARGLLAPRSPRLAAAGVALLCVLSWGAGRELFRQLADIAGTLEGVAARMAAAPPGTTLLFDEPNHAARVLYYLDRPALLRLDPPRRWEEVYTLGVPDGFTAAGRPVETLWKPHETPDEETRRWAALAAKVAAGEVSGETSDFGFMRAVATAKSLEFRERHKAAFARAAAGRGATR